MKTYLQMCMNEDRTMKGKPRQAAPRPQRHHRKFFLSGSAPATSTLVPGGYVARKGRSGTRMRRILQRFKFFLRSTACSPCRGYLVLEWNI